PAHDALLLVELDHHRPRIEPQRGGEALRIVTIEGDGELGASVVAVPFETQHDRAPIRRVRPAETDLAALGRLHAETAVERRHLRSRPLAGARVAEVESSALQGEPRALDRLAAVVDELAAELEHRAIADGGGLREDLRPSAHAHLASE